MEKTIIAAGALWFVGSLVINMSCLLLLALWDKKNPSNILVIPLLPSIAISLCRMAGIFYIIKRFIGISGMTIPLLTLAIFDLSILFCISAFIAPRYGRNAFSTRYADGQFLGSIIFSIVFLQTYVFMH